MFSRFDTISECHGRTDKTAMPITRSV